MIKEWLRPRILGAISVLFYTLLISACSPSEPSFHESETPLRLSAWKLLTIDGDALIPHPSSLVFRPANQLFTDYAHKLRTLWIPTGSQARLVNGEIDYPPGSVLTKTFYYPLDPEGRYLKTIDHGVAAIDLQKNRLIETRLLVRRESGWKAMPYVWNDEQSEAFLRVAGASKSVQLVRDEGILDFVYFVPNENQCSACHVTEHPDGQMHPLGATARELSSSFDHAGDDPVLQTELMRKRSWLDQLPTRMEAVSWQTYSADIQDPALVEELALAYLNIHCGHCHNPEGAADTSGLLLDGSHSLAVNLGVCKPPVAAGGGAGDLQFSIVPAAPEKSILIYRMNSLAPDEMMPELGRSLVHHEGLELIRHWIATMPGGC
ncbi:MAG: SO2930 family diheme c-type cytochrome [Pseudohongiellaceae bacterium]|jgi:uncharacterized repeat protein (TIGR03806 family)|nr:hypothetical protein [Gammaproteobacteria bacterium]